MRAFEERGDEVARREQTTVRISELERERERELEREGLEGVDGALAPRFISNPLFPVCF